MIMTEPNVIDMCNVYEPRVPRERPRDRGETQPGPWTLLLPPPPPRVVYLSAYLVHNQRPFNPRAR